MSGGTFQPRIICPGGHYIGGTSNPTTQSMLICEFLEWILYNQHY